MCVFFCKCFKARLLNYVLYQRQSFPISLIQIIIIVQRKQILDTETVFDIPCAPGHYFEHFCAQEEKNTHKPICNDFALYANKQEGQFNTQYTDHTGHLYVKTALWWTLLLFPFYIIRNHDDHSCMLNFFFYYSWITIETSCVYFYFSSSLLEQERDFY